MLYVYQFFFLIEFIFGKCFGICDVDLVKEKYFTPKLNFLVKLMTCYTTDLFASSINYEI